MATDKATANTNIRNGLDARKKFEEVWAECDNFLRSEQNIYRTPDGRLIRAATIPAIQRKIRHVYNIITSRFLREVSTYTGQFSGWHVDPAPPAGSVIGEVSYDSSQQAAVAGERQLMNDYDQLHLGRVTARAKWLACEFGEGYLWPMYDPTKGKPIGKTGKYTGLNCVKVLDPSQVVWRQGRRFEESDFHAIRCTYTKEEVASRYSIPKEEIRADAIAHESLSDALIDEGYSDANLVTVWEYYERPTPQNPKGVHLTLLGERELLREDYPYLFDETDDEPWLVRYVYVQPERQSRGKGMVQDMIDGQRAFNRRMNLLSEWTGIAANPMPVINKRTADTQRQSVYPGKTWVSEPAFDQGQPLSFVQVPQLPDWFASSPEKILAMQDQVTGQYDLQNIASTAAAATVQQIVDQNTASRGDVARGFNDSDARLATRLLLLARKNYTEPRTLAYRGESGESQIKGFVASRELPKPCRVRVTSGVPKTADQNAAMISNWAAQGWIPPSIAILAIQKNQPELVTDPIEKNITKQQRENQQIFRLDENEIAKIMRDQARIDAAFAAAGVDVSQAPEPPGPWPMPSVYDDDETHMRQMESWFLTPEYETMLGPAAKQAAQWHYEAHKSQAARKAMEQQQERNMRAAALGMNNAASPGQDKLIPSQPGIPEGGEAPPQTDPQPVER